MFAKERQEKIEQYIVGHGSVSVQMLSERFNVSEVTIRKDLDELSKGNRITRTHGGAVAKYQTRMNVGMDDLVIIHPEAKKRIAEKAMEYIEDGDSVMLDVSTTVLEFAKLINQSDRKNITVITPSLMVGRVFNNEAITVMVIGGILNQRLDATCGTVAEKLIKTISADKCFLGVNGIDSAFGLSTSDFTDACLKSAMCDASKQCFVLADHSKFHKRYLAQICKLEQKVDCIITDEKAEGVDYESIQHKVEIVFTK